MLNLEQALIGIMPTPSISMWADPSAASLDPYIVYFSIPGNIVCSGHT